MIDQLQEAASQPASRSKQIVLVGSVFFTQNINVSATFVHVLAQIQYETPKWTTKVHRMPVEIKTIYGHVQTVPSYYRMDEEVTVQTMFKIKHNRNLT